MNVIPWFERNLSFGKPAEMLPFYLERLSGTILRIEAKVQAVPDQILSARFDGKWSIKENIGHLGEVDEIANKRIVEMTTGISPMSPAVFEPKGDYNAKSINEVIAEFRSLREKNIGRYESLSSEDLTKTSLHPRLKLLMSPVDLAWFDAEHDDHHLVKINEILKTHWRP